MALINCNDCNNQISESAESCPKCGAPVPKVLREGQEQCPFCMTTVEEHATVCPGCRAMKGYTHASGNVYGRGKTIWFGILLPIILTIVSGIFGAGVAGFVFLIMLIPIIGSAWRLMRGPIWFQTTNVHN